jgi:hypothetical protein
MRSDWSCDGAPGGAANAAGCRSTNGRTSGGRPGRPKIAAPPPSPELKTGSGGMCVPGSPIGRSRSSPPPMCAAGRRNWRAPWGRQRSRSADPWRCASSTSPWTKARSTPTPSARCHPPRLAPIPTRSSATPGAAPSPPRRPGGCWPASRCLVGPRAHPARHRPSFR